VPNRDDPTSIIMYAFIVSEFLCISTSWKAQDDGACWTRRCVELLLYCAEEESCGLGLTGLRRSMYIRVWYLYDVQYVRTVHLQFTRYSIYRYDTLYQVCTVSTVAGSGT
jgi:hypothetical protein